MKLSAITANTPQAMAMTPRRERCDGTDEGRITINLSSARKNEA
jgi:hypothetical protein